MQQILELWQRLELKRRVIIVGATVAVFLAVLALSRVATRPDMALLFAGLEAETSGEVIAALEARGAIYEVRGSSIYVNSQARDELRMTLASDGLPGNGSRGYEILDSLSGFGTTAQMFDSAYWRAKEGELARTIAGGQSVRSARVHIAGVDGSPFSRNLRPTASVSVSTLNGTVSPQQAQAIRHLVAGAVSGLLPEDVAVVDARGMLVSASGDQATPAEDNADGMRQRVQRLLEARVGQGNAIVELSVETVTERETIRERVIDPASRVAISTDTEETSGKENGSASGVTVASNLPDSGAAADGSSSSQNTQSRERVNYEISETQREISREPGSVRRLSVAVLVNGTQSMSANGTPQMQARSEEELDALKELVASAVGYDASRGDVITIKSMQFEPLAPLPENTVPGLLERLHFDGTALLKTGILAIVALVLGLFVLRPLFSNARPPLPAPQQLGIAPRQMPGMSGSLPGLTGEIDDRENDLSNLQAVNAHASTAVSTTLRPSVAGALPTEAQLSRLKGVITGREQETVDVLRSWLEEREDVA